MIKSICSYLKIALLTFCVLGFSNNIYAATLVDPKPIVVPEGLTIEHVEKAIRGAVGAKGWLIEGVGENSLDASYSIRSHKLVLGILYNEERVEFKYKSSVNLKYKKRKTKETIHRNYMPWTQSLADRIFGNLSLGEDYTPEKLGTEAPRNHAPKEAFSAFGSFVLEAVTLSEKYRDIGGNNRTATNLEHNLNVELNDQLAEWEAGSDSERVLIVRANIEKLKFIGSGVRLFSGRMAGRSWMTVKISFLDQSTGDVIAEPVLYRVAGHANGFTLSKADYEMVEEMARDIKQYMIENYHESVGGGTYPPAKFR